MVFWEWEWECICIIGRNDGNEVDDVDNLTGVEGKVEVRVYSRL